MVVKFNNIGAEHVLRLPAVSAAEENGYCWSVASDYQEKQTEKHKDMVFQSFSKLSGVRKVQHFVTRVCFL